VAREGGVPETVRVHLFPLTEMPDERVRIWSAYVVVSTVWGSTWLAMKIGLETVPPFFAAGLRFLVASAILYGVIRVRGLKVDFSGDARRVYLTLGVFSFFIPFALSYWGQRTIPSGLGSILFAVYPFSVALFSRLMLPAEKLDRYKVLGILLAFIGLVAIFSGDLTVSDERALAGMLAVLASAILAGYSLVVIKKYGQPMNPFVMNFVGMAIGTVLLLALALAVEPVASVAWSWTGVCSILFLALFGSVLAFVSYYWLLKRMDAVYLSLTSFINPVVAVTLGAAVLGEALEENVFAGAALVMAGILLANGKALEEKYRKRLVPGGLHER
jgi:drug/metabolite transporter (DMT)-like permease